MSDRWRGIFCCLMERNQDDETETGHESFPMLDMSMKSNGIHEQSVPTLHDARESSHQRADSSSVAMHDSGQDEDDSDLEERFELIGNAELDTMFDASEDELLTDQEDGIVRGEKQMLSVPKQVRKISTHSKASNRSDIKGEMYEIKMAILFYLRGINSGRDFQIATNVSGAGALDDVVFKFRTPDEPHVWHTCFVQLKHKKKTNISRNALLSDTNDFGLCKYFHSYTEIKNLMAKIKRDPIFEGTFDCCHFVIYTNASLYSDLKNLNRAEVWCPIDEYLKSGEDSETCVSFNETDDADIYSHLQKDNQLVEANDFLNRLKLFTGEPTEIVLDEMIKRQLAKVCQLFEIVYPDHSNLFRLCVQNFTDWWDKNSAETLNQNSSILQQILDQAQSEAVMLHVDDLVHKQLKMVRFDFIKFKKSSTEIIDNVLENQIVNIVTDVSSLKIVASKLHQTLRNKSCVFLGCKISAEDWDMAIVSWKCGMKDTLVIVCDQVIEEAGLLCNKLLRVLDERQNKKIIIVSTQDDSIVKGMKPNPVVVTVEEFNGSQLDDVTVNNILNKAVSFQGKDTLFRAIFDNDFSHMASHICDRFLERIETEVPLKIAENLKENIKYFVPRILLQENSVNRNIFTDRFYKGKIVIHGTRKDIGRLLPGNEKRFAETSTGLVFSSIHDTRHQSSEMEDGKLIGSKTALSPMKEIRTADNEWQDHDEDDMYKNSGQDIHTLQLVGRNLIWDKSFGNIDFIKRYIDDKIPSEFEESHQRVLLLVGEPGMGKSVQMTHIAQRIKDEHPNMWVIPVTLNKHSNLFSKVNDTDWDVSEFLSAVLNVDNEEVSIDKEILLHCLNSGNLAVLLDGVDEVAPKYADSCNKLLKSLLETKVKHIWVSSRHSMKDELEKMLSTLAITLKQFSENDQTSFLMKYYEGSSIPQLSEYVAQVLERTSESWDDSDKTFTGNPLHARMLAEIYHDDVTRPDDGSQSKALAKLNLLQLIERLVEKKLEMHIKRELNATGDLHTDILEVIREKFYDKHMKAALALLVGESELEKLDILDRKRKSDGAAMATEYEDIFQHRLFTQYFAAKWFVLNYDNNNQYIKDHLFGDTFAVFRNMFDRILAEDHVLLSAVLNSSVSDVDNFLENIHERDKAGRCALHLAMTACSDNHREHNKSVAILNALLTSKLHYPHLDTKDELINKTPLQYADASGFWNTLGVVRRRKPVKTVTQRAMELKSIPIAFTVKFSDKVLLNDHAHLMKLILDLGVSVEARFFDDKSSTLLHKSAELNSVSIVKLLISRGSRVRTTDRTNATPLHRAAANNHLQVVIALNKDDLKSSGQFKLLVKYHNYIAGSAKVKYVNEYDRHRNTALSLASANGHKDTVDYLIKSQSYIADLNDMNWTPLMKACFGGHVSIARLLLENIVDVDESKLKYIQRQNNEGKTAFALAAEGGHYDVVSFLINQGSDVLAKNNIDGSQGWDPLMSAAYNGHHLVVKLLLDSFDEDLLVDLVKRQDRKKRTALFLAATQGHRRIVEMLIASKGTILTHDEDGNTPLIAACNNSHKDVVDLILMSFVYVQDREDHVNEMSKNGHTATLMAAWSGSETIVTCLIKSGGDVTLRDPVNGLGWTPLLAASAQGHRQVVDIILKSFVDENSKLQYINTTANDGNSAVYFASKKGYIEIVQLLIASGANFTSQGNQGKTSLMTASYNGHLSLVKFLLARIADDMTRTAYVNARYNAGSSAVCFASSNGHTQIIDALICAGADVMLADGLGTTALMFATKGRHQKAVEVLLKSFKDEDQRIKYVNAVDSEGDSAVHMAAYEGLSDVMKMLIDFKGDETLANRSGRTPRMIVEKYEELRINKSFLPEWFGFLTRPISELSSCLDRGHSQDDDDDDDDD